MAIPIDESTLLTVAGLIFIPVFGFCIKMIMEMSSYKARMKEFDDHIIEAKEWKKEITELQNAKNILELRLMTMERSIQTHEKEIQDITMRRYYRQGQQQLHDQSPVRGGDNEERHDNK